MTQDLHVIFGTGPIGLAVMDELVKRGKQVRLVNRSGRRSVDMPSQVEIVAGDATDSNSTRKNSAGAAVIYNCTNAPDYHRWPEQFPPLQAAILDAAVHSGAKLVALENVYMYGATGGKPITEDLPYRAKGPRGSTRARMTEALQQASADGKVRMTIGRAADFFGPRTIQSAMGEQPFKAALTGKKAQVLLSAEHLHTYTYTPDIGKGLVILGESDQADGEVWHLPTSETITTREFLRRVYAEVGQPLKIQVAPRLLVWALGWVVPPMRNLLELDYEFQEPFIVDHSKFARTFGNHATPLNEAIHTTLAWYRDHLQAAH